jgi:hypothetical protein
MIDLAQCFGPFHDCTENLNYCLRCLSSLINHTGASLAQRTFFNLLVPHAGYILADIGQLYYREIGKVGQL